MDKILPEDEEHRYLVSAYIYNKFLYHLSFKKRISMDLGNISYNISTYSNKYDDISCNELYIMLEKLRKPWWNSLYEKRIKRNIKALIIFNLLLNMRYYGFQTFKLIYKVIKEKEKLD